MRRGCERGEARAAQWRVVDNEDQREGWQQERFWHGTAEMASATSVACTIDAEMLEKWLALWIRMSSCLCG